MDERLRKKTGREKTIDVTEMKVLRWACGNPTVDSRENMTIKEKAKVMELY